MKPLSSYPSSAMAALSGLLGQRTRQITLETALTADDLVVERFVAQEGVCTPFRLQIDCLSPSAHLDTARLATEEITLRLMLADGSRRAWHGYVQACAAIGGDGGLARYRLTVGTWFDQLRARTDCYVYQDKTALEVIEDVLADYPLARYRMAVSQPLRKRSVCCQYRETDLAFVTRLLAEEGLSYRFEHQQDDAGQSSQEDKAQSRHCLVIFDNQAERPACAQASIRFHRSDATEREDAIDHWSLQAAAGTNAVTVASWDYKSLAATAADAGSESLGEWPTLESFETRGTYRYPDADAARRAAQLRAQAYESRYLRYAGEGSVRALGAGERFTLTGHFDTAANEFVTLAVRHEAANNMGAEVALLLGLSDIEAGSYRNRFEAVRADAPIVPVYSPKPTAPEGQPAVVIAEGGAPLTTERDHRVRVRLPWLRAPMADARADTAADPAQDDLSQVTAWVRVATAAAGPNWGAHHLPRAGTEVMLTYLDGDIDRPMVVAQLHNEQDALPWPATEAPLNTALSGWHSHNLGDGGYNQWVVDDNTGQLRMRLASSAADTQLNLGYVIAQAPASGERGAWRGTGAELRTDAWAIVRAGNGLLLSTTVQARAAGTMLDIREARGQITAAERTAQRLSDAATSQQALPLGAVAAFEPLTKAIDPQQDGSYPERVNEQDAKRPDTGTAAEHFGQPWLVAESPSSIALATQATTSIFAGRHLLGLAQADWHVGAGNTVAAAAAKGVSLFSQNNGIRAIAAGGPVSIQAHTDALAVMADKAVTVTSSTDGIEVLAQKKVVLHGGSSRIVLDGNAITFETPGLLSVKGAGHPLVGGGGNPAELAALPVGTSTLSNAIDLNFQYDDLEPVEGAPYKIVFSDNTIREGKLDKQGFARIEGVPNLSYYVEFGEDERPWKAPPLEKSTDYKKAQPEAERLIEAERLERLAAGDLRAAEKS
ncbi:type VI secretion system Vgr family protein [Cupriavidus nantongensis]|uniref:type VI secretion system Vgr family protein n=1 Tax=Cupriavidus nantongensis TaxID=1796606 RepID=UPI0022466C72|nr:type VI secretion system Vgr family protein [Cupriavidus nantongensis]